MSDTTVRIIIDASGAQRGGSTAERALDRVGNASRRLDASLGRTTVNVRTFSSTLSSLKGAAAIGILTGLTKKAMEFTDASSLMDAKLKLAVANWGNYGQAQADVSRISAVTRSELTSTAVLYGKMAASGKNLNASQAQVARATETVTESLKVSGASAGETASTVLQLGQALSSGKLNGDEFRSLAENAPRLMKLMADSMGVPIGALKKMASEGKLTSEKLFRAFTDPKYFAALDAEAKSIPATFGDAFTAIENVATRTFGAFDSGGGFSQALYNFANQGSENMNSITKRAADAGGEIRDAFAGLGDAFQPLLNGANGVFDALGIRIGTVKEQIGGLLGIMDNIANAPIKLQNWANDVDRSMRPEWAQAGIPKNQPLQNMKGDFNAGFEKSRRDRALDKLIANTRTVTGDSSFTGKGMTPKAIFDKFWAAMPAYKAKQGGTGQLRAVPGTSTTTGSGGKSRRDVDDIMNSIGARVTSGYRSFEHNKEVGGQPNSYHLTGNARDIAKTKGMTLGKVVSALKEQGYDVVEKLDEGDHFHVAWKGKGDKSKSESEKAAISAQREAEYLAERRQKQETELWSTMDNQLALAKLMPAEAEKLNAEQELTHIRGAQITQQDKDRIGLLMDQTRAAKLLTEITAANDNGAAELDFQKRKLGMTDKEAAMAEAAWEFESKALADKVDTSNALYQITLATIKARAGETFEIQKQNRMLKDRESLLSEYSPREADNQRLDQIKADRDRLGVLRSKPVADGGITEEQYRRALDGVDKAGVEIAVRWEREFGGKIDQLGEQLGGVFGRAVGSFGKLISGLADAAAGKFGGLGPLGSVIDLLGTKSDGTANALGKAAADASKKSMDQLLGRNGEASAFKNPLKSLSSGFDGFKTDLKGIFGKNGDFTKSIGSVLGKAAGGAQMGETADQLMKAIGLKSSKLGSQIGGAIGGAVAGPLGSIVGGIAGGLFGGLFKKTKQASAGFELDSFGNLQGMKATGTGAKERETATALANSVASGLNSIASQLGGTLTGAGGISVGYRPGHKAGAYRVDTTGAGRLTGVDAFDNEADAIAFAIKSALKTGILDGVSDFSKRLLSATENLDSALALATTYENILKELAAIDDPIGAPLKELNEQFEKLNKSMTANGATAGELANVDRYYMVQRQKMLEDQLSSIKSLQDKLNGADSGVSNKSRLDKQLKEFRAYEDTIAKGGSVDPTKFAELGSSIFDIARDLYGTSGPLFQNIRNELLNASDAMTKNVESMYGTSSDSTTVVQAVDTQTQLIAQQIKEQQKGNAIQERIAAALEAANDVEDLMRNAKAVNGYQYGTV